jgi:hypothetical protein
MIRPEPRLHGKRPISRSFPFAFAVYSTTAGDDGSGGFGIGGSGYSGGEGEFRRFLHSLGAVMNAGLLILIVVVVVVIVALAVLLARRRRSQGLQERFGPEYERTLARAGDRRAAESDLSEREHVRHELDIVPLDAETRTRYQQEWRATQGRFVDDPTGATRDADGLVSRLMSERGYPVDDDFERQAAVVSVDHPQVAENYRAAHAVHRANEQGLATTDDLREAFVHYRSLFSQLLDVDGDDRDDRKEEAHQ